MHMNQEELYSLGLLSGLSNAANGENRIEVRRSAYGVIKFVAESLSEFGIFKDLVRSTGRSSQWSSITWDPKELSEYLNSVELGIFNYHHFQWDALTQDSSYRVATRQRDHMSSLRPMINSKNQWQN